jgi:hypothetical protein
MTISRISELEKEVWDSVAFLNWVGWEKGRIWL